MAVTNNPDSPENPGTGAESIWSESSKTQPIEVWLSKRSSKFTGHVVYESERAYL